jgi:hypothetical protein
VRSVLFASFALALAGCPSEREYSWRYDAALGDTDGDGILDVDEHPPRDTDGDLAPDAADTDSDGDSILDRIEAGDDVLETPPVDSDHDGDPDFVDTDSDDNGIGDRFEADGDLDGDGTLDFADLDDDGDLLTDAVELGDTFGAPLDHDGDGMPDYRDPDSDQDTILDGHDRDVDTDRDGAPDMFDEDSDQDGFSDREEAGDDILTTPPVDTDGDGTLDFRDPDSDNDGLSDAAELGLGTDRTDGDSDGDDVSDLIEVGAGTDPLDAADNPRVRGDFVFVVPYRAPPAPSRDTLEFTTDLQLADVYFLFDRTGSMAPETNSLRSAVASIIENLTCESSGAACANDGECAAGEICALSGTCIEAPAINGCIPSVWTGAGVYGGSSLMYPIDNLASLSADASATEAALPTDVGVYGSDEALFQAAECIADPSRCPVGRTRGCVMTGVGCPGFRPGALKMLVVITDERNELVDLAYDASSAGAALTAAGITFVGIDADVAHAGRADLEAIARASSSLDSDGTPLVYDGDEGAVVSAVSAAIGEITHEVPFRATTEVIDEEGDDGDAAPFIARLEVSTSGPACSTAGAIDTDLDGFRDTFVSLRPGTPVCWDVVPRENTIVPPELSPLVFRARVRVLGDGSPLDERRVHFLVPPRIPEPGLI